MPHTLRGNHNKDVVSHTLPQVYTEAYLPDVEAVGLRHAIAQVQPATNNVLFSGTRPCKMQAAVTSLFTSCAYHAHKWFWSGTCLAIRPSTYDECFGPFVVWNPSHVLRPALFYALHQPPLHIVFSYYIWAALSLAGGAEGQCKASSEEDAAQSNSNLVNVTFTF